MRKSKIPILAKVPEEIHKYHKNRKGSKGWDLYVSGLFKNIMEKDEIDKVSHLFK